MKKRQKTYRLRSGVVVTDSDIRRMADDVATRDFDLSKFTRLPGRPLMGKAVAEVVPVRIEPSIVESIDRRARKEGTTRSDIIRQAIKIYLASEAVEASGVAPVVCIVMRTPIMAITRPTTASAPRRSSKRIAPSIVLRAGVRKNRLLTFAAV